MIETTDSLISNHQGLVVGIAKKIYRRLPKFILFEDVLSYGQLGLAQAARTYQPVAGTEFSTFAHYRISGAIYDGLSRMNWNSRQEFRNYKASQVASEVLEEASSDVASDTEGQASRFSDTVRQLSRIFEFSSLGEKDDFQDQLVGSAKNPSNVAESNEDKARLKIAMEQLSDEDRQFITLVYHEDRTIASVAEGLGKSRSWGCRRHAKILQELAAVFA